MRNFTTEDFSGGGQYLLRMSTEEIVCREKNEPFRGYASAGYLSTIIKKVGYCKGKGCENPPETGNIMTLVDMSDGLTSLGYFDTRNDPEFRNNGGAANTDLWVWVQFSEKQALCDYLNNPDLCQQEMRFATQEEVVRAVMYQRSRWRG